MRGQCHLNRGTAVLTACCLLAVPVASENTVFDGWSTESPRDEIRPRFSVLPTGSPSGGPCLVISGDGNESADGGWIKTFKIRGGEVYRFSVLRETRDVDSPLRSGPVVITWQDDQGRLVDGEREDPQDKARPEFPMDQNVRDDGWQVVADTYKTPSGATQARVELRLRWTGGTVRWVEDAVHGLSVEVDDASASPGGRW